jgi:hypothetical protein
VKHFSQIPAFRSRHVHRGASSDLWLVLALGIVLVALLLASLSLQAQTPNTNAANGVPQSATKLAPKPARSAVAAVKSFRLVQEKDGQAVEILSTKPLVPSIQAISDPARIVIDLPNATLEGQSKGVLQRIEVNADQITALRANQFQANPPITRIVVDLQAPRSYTWDAAGNRLVVHLGKSPGEVAAAVAAPTIAGLRSATSPVVASVRAAGPLSLAGDAGSVGSTIAAAADTAIVRLSSGGEVRVCPGTTLSVTPSQNRHNLMLSMNTGAMEAHFALDASSDTVMTPDFRIQLVGPGEFHYAFSADAQGNTCVRALAGNTASAIVSELLGDRTYQVKATDQLVFRAGQLDRVDMAVPLECGCPPPHDAPMRVTSELPIQTQSQASAPQTATATATPQSTAPSATSPAEVAPGAVASPLQASPAPNSLPANDLHVQIEAPFVFHASGPPPVAKADIAALPLATRPAEAPAVDAALPPPAQDAAKSSAADAAAASKPPSRGFFKRLGGFFSALFH